jgi:hypothetical protein
MMGVWMACWCAVSDVEIGMYMWSVCGFDHVSMKSS